MKQIQIVRRSIEGSSGEWHETDDVVALLRREFGQCPSNARLYHRFVSEETDVTPRTPDEERALADMEGPFYFIVQPGTGIEWVPIIVSLAVSAASMLLQMVFAPTPPTATNRQVRDESPNNGLAERTNQARVNGRIPRIVGEVRSTPDLIAGVYKIFQDHREKEVAYMCIGEGAFDILDVRDDTTPIDQIAGASVEIYGPNTSPNSGDPPQLRIGNPINLPVTTTQRANAINGQSLLAQDAGRVVRRATVFESPNRVVSTDTAIDLTEYFVVGDTLVITEAEQTDTRYSEPAGPSTFDVDSGIDPENGYMYLSGDRTAQWRPGDVVTISNGTVSWRATTSGEGDYEYTQSTNINGIYPIVDVDYVLAEDHTEVVLDLTGMSSTWGLFEISSRVSAVTGSPNLSRPSDTVQFDLSGTYTINTVSASTITLNNPVAVNPDWNVLANDYGGVSQTLYPILETSGERWVGWFNVSMQKPMSGFIANMVALNGLYAMERDGTQVRQDVTVRVEAQRIDAGGDPYGPVEVFNDTVQGSAVTRTGRAKTMHVTLPGAPSQHWRFRARRISSTPTGFAPVVDNVQWRELYTESTVEAEHFGNVTTLQAVTFATDGALAQKQRKTNCLVVSRLPILNAGGTFGPPAATREFKDILCSLCFDPKIGNRSPDEVDLQNIYQTWVDVRDYFGIDQAAQFNYTFDKADLSFEETITALAEAVFCRAYRRGSVLRLHFERQTDESVLLFNHRNTLPGTEKRTTSFGPVEGYDGVAYQYVSPDDDVVTTLYLPDQNRVNPKTIESIGVRDHRVAHLHAWREWNKIRYQHTTVERQCLQEADMLVLGERVTLSDTTRSGEQAGYVESVDGLLLHLSQPTKWPEGVATQYIFIQNSDAVVESIPIVRGPIDRTVILDRTPRTPIVVRGANPTAYIIGSSLAARQAQPFLVTGKEPGDGMTVTLSCVNYDDRYYQNDGDYRP